MKTLPRWLCLLLLAAVAGPALAAELPVAFLTPGKYAVAQDESIPLRFDVGRAEDARPGPWPSDRVAWLFVRGGSTQQNRHDVRPDRPQDDSVTVTIEHPGVTLIGIDERPAVLNLTGAELGAFLRANVAELSRADAARLPNGSEPVRVRHVVSAKTLVRAPNADGSSGPSPIATSKSGQAVEIRSLFDPTAIRPGSDLPMRLYVDGDKQTGVKVQATHVPSGRTTSFVADPVGSGYFRVTDAGLWRVEFHHARPLEGDAAADWVLYTATLTFEVMKGAGQ